MIKILEVVGTSANNFSEATQNAIEYLAKEGKKIYYFEVIEQRGAVKDNKIKEFQVILKVGYQN